MLDKNKTFCVFYVGVFCAQARCALRMKGYKAGGVDVRFCGAAVLV